MGSDGIELTRDKILYLLDELCRTMGYCLAPTEKHRISEIAGLSAETFTDEILKASGFLSEHEKQKRREIEARISHYLDRWSQP
jgi:hypothetical protein